MTSSVSRIRFPAWALVGAAVLLLTSLVTLQSVRGASVTPILVSETANLTCQQLAAAYGAPGESWLELKVDPNPEGAGPFNYSDGVLSVTITNATDDGFNWTSNIGVDAVYVKGGAGGSHLYRYDPPAESTGDTGLVIPNAANNDISHISFCYDIELVVTKTAEPTFTRTFTWDIDKAVTPATWDLFEGDTGTSEYTVTVTRTGFEDTGHAVSGTITIRNPHPSASATVTGVTDTISGGITAAVDCPVTFPYTLAAGSTLTCEYSSSLPDGSSRVNTATATTNNANGIGTGSGTADIVFGDPTTVVDGTVNVTDSVEGDLGEFTDTDSVTYIRTFACDADEGTHGNTATIEETGDFDSASVEVNCHDLGVTKTARTSLTRTWTWTIEKLGSETELTLAPGQLYTVDYDVAVDATSQDSGWAVTGDIEVTNNAPIDATITDVTDLVSPDIAASVDCGVTFPYSLPSNETLACTYSAALADAAGRTNTATATLQNHDYDEEGIGTPSGTTDFSGTASVDFGSATVTEIDECVDVTDTNAVTATNADGLLGVVCASDAPETFSYSLAFGQHPDADVQLDCGENTHTNVAAFEANDTGASDTSTWTVDAHVACVTGCTLTQGYWKTHSHRGPAPFDDGWNAIGDADGDGAVEGADEAFFSSGMTWYQLFWTPPKGGNVYIQLAHQYMAATLNVANGADSTAAVDAALAGAEAFFESGKTPSSSLTKAQKNQLLGWASALDQYNNGLIGPGHCDEQ